MAFINVKRKTIKLPNGMKINFNKDSISYTVSNGKASYTYNPKKKMETKNVKRKSIKMKSKLLTQNFVISSQMV